MQWPSRVSLRAARRRDRPAERDAITLAQLSAHWRKARLASSNAVLMIGGVWIGDSALAIARAAVRRPRQPAPRRRPLTAARADGARIASNAWRSRGAACWSRAGKRPGRPTARASRCWRWCGCWATASNRASARSWSEATSLWRWRPRGPSAHAVRVRCSTCSVASAPGSDTTAIEAGMMLEANRLTLEAPSEDELSRVKLELERDLLFDLQTARGRAQALGAAELLAGDWREADRDVDRLRRLRPDDVKAAAARVLRPEQFTAVWMRPGAAPARAGRGRTMNRACSFGPPAVAPPWSRRPCCRFRPPPRSPPRTGFRCPRRARCPTACGSSCSRITGCASCRCPVRVPAGVDAEPETQSGVANLTAQCLLRAARSSRRARTLSRRARAVSAARCRSAASRDVATHERRVRRLTARGGLELMSDMVINPLFPDADVRRLANQNASTGTAAAPEPGVRPRTSSSGARVRGHPHGPDAAATTASLLNAGSASRCGSSIATATGPIAAVLVIAGDVTLERAFGAGRVSGSARWAGAREPPRGAARARARARVRHGIDMPGARDARFASALLVPGRRASGRRGTGHVARGSCSSSSSPAARVAAPMPAEPRAAMALLRDTGVWAMGGAGPRTPRAHWRRACAPAAPLRQLPPGADAGERGAPRGDRRLPAALRDARTAGRRSGSPPTSRAARRLPARMPQQLGPPSSQDMAAALRPAAATIGSGAGRGPAHSLKRTLASLGPAEVLSLDAVGERGFARTACRPRPTPRRCGARQAAGSGRRSRRTAALAKLRSIQGSVIDAELHAALSGRRARPGRVRQIRKDPDRIV